MGDVYVAHPNQICAWKVQLLDNAACAFDPGVGIDTFAAAERANYPSASEYDPDWQDPAPKWRGPQLAEKGAAERAKSAAIQ